MKRDPIAVKLRHMLYKSIRIAGIVLFLGALFAVFLFVNHFRLEILPLEGDTLLVQKDSIYTDPGAQARLTGNLLFRNGVVLDIAVTQTGKVDTSVPGSYIIGYEGRFLFLTGTGERTVSVQDQDPPQIALHFVSGHYTIPGETYQEEGYTAWDSFDGDLTDQVVRRESDGFVTYTVTDSMGSTTSVRRKIYYYDTVPPVITLNGDEVINIDAASGYIDPGITVMDNVDGDISHRVRIEGIVDPYIAGTYTLNYVVTDQAGNSACAVRTVNVLGKEKVEQVTPEEKTIYLTFDDGPSAHTEDLLDILQKYNVKATFFVVRTDYLNLLQRIAEEGHAIGIHSVTHDYEQIYACADAYFEDLRAMQKIIYDQCGVMTYLMRFPGGSSNTVSDFNPGIMTYLTQAVEDAGFTYFDWNVDSNDAGRARTSKKVLKNMKSGVEDRDYSIVLQHDTKKFSIEAVEKFIQWALENGYTFSALDATSPTAHHSLNN